jgi:hypothetical protein
MTRNFSHRLATRDKTPLLVGLVGSSGSGKTFSALRLATGFKRANPGEIFLIDTEAGRALQYADDFKFAHVPFGAPFGPLDYLGVIKYCVDNGATNIVIDSMSHEWEGPGGVLEIQAGEFLRLGPKLQGLSWNKPKSEHRRLINTILQFNCNFIFCFRAKEKLDWDAKPPAKLGFMAIGGGEWMFEMTAQCLLLPGSNGIPTWKSNLAGEQDTIKLPKQFISTFEGAPQLTEDVGEAMAKWAAGSSLTPKMTAVELLKEYAACSEPSEFRRLQEIGKASWSALSKDDRPRVKTASEQCAKRIEDAAKAPEPAPPPADDDGFFDEKAGAA